MWYRKLILFVDRWNFFLAAYLVLFQEKLSIVACVLSVLSVYLMTANVSDSMDKSCNFREKAFGNQKNIEQFASGDIVRLLR